MCVHTVPIVFWHASNIAAAAAAADAHSAQFWCLQNEIETETSFRGNCCCCGGCGCCCCCACCLCCCCSSLGMPLPCSFASSFVPWQINQFAWPSLGIFCCPCCRVAVAVLLLLLLLLPGIIVALHQATNMKHEHHQRHFNARLVQSYKPNFGRVSPLFLPPLRPLYLPLCLLCCWLRTRTTWPKKKAY